MHSVDINKMIETLHDQYVFRDTLPKKDMCSFMFQISWKIVILLKWVVELSFFDSLSSIFDFILYVIILCCLLFIQNFNAVNFFFLNMNKKREDIL